MQHLHKGCKKHLQKGRFAFSMEWGCCEVECEDKGRRKQEGGDVEM